MTRNFILLALVFSSFISSGQSPAKFEFFLSERSAKIPSIYSSADNLYLKDLVTEPPQKIIIELTKTEREQILKKVESINFFDYPDVYKFENADSTKPATLSPPCTQFNLTVFVDEKNKYVSWNNCHTGAPSKNNMYENLEDLRMLIDNFLFSRENYKNSQPVKTTR